MKCPECGAIAAEDEFFCGECGAVLPASDVEGAEPVQPVDPRARRAYTLGIASIVLPLVICIPGLNIVSWLGPIVGIIAIIMGARAKSDIEAQGGPDAEREKAHRGMIMGIVGMALFFVGLVIVGALGIGLSILNDM